MKNIHPDLKYFLNALIAYGKPIKFSVVVKHAIASGYKTKAADVNKSSLYEIGYGRAPNVPVGLISKTADGEYFINDPSLIPAATGSSKKKTQRTRQPKFIEPMKKDAEKQLHYDLQRGLCKGCGKPYPINALQIDHDLSDKKRGGTNHQNNLQLLCGSCNASKGELTLYEWKGPDWLREFNDLTCQVKIKNDGYVSNRKFTHLAVKAAHLETDQKETNE